MDLLDELKVYNIINGKKLGNIEYNEKNIERSNEVSKFIIENGLNIDMVNNLANFYRYFRRLSYGSLRFDRRGITIKCINHNIEDYDINLNNIFDKIYSLKDIYRFKITKRFNRNEYHYEINIYCDYSGYYEFVVRLDENNNYYIITNIKSSQIKSGTFDKYNEEYSKLLKNEEESRKEYEIQAQTNYSRFSIGYSRRDRYESQWYSTSTYRTYQIEETDLKNKYYKDITLELKFTELSEDCIKSLKFLINNYANIDFKYHDVPLTTLKDLYKNIMNKCDKYCDMEDFKPYDYIMTSDNIVITKETEKLELPPIEDIFKN